MDGAIRLRTGVTAAWAEEQVAVSSVREGAGLGAVVVAILGAGVGEAAT